MTSEEIEHSLKAPCPECNGSGLQRYNNLYGPPPKQYCFSCCGSGLLDVYLALYYRTGSLVECIRQVNENAHCGKEPPWEIKLNDDF